MDPHALLCTDASPARQLANNRAWVAQLNLPDPMPPTPRIDPAPPQRITLGYLSGDFREHAVASLVAGLFDHHDRDRFAVFGYALGGDDGSAMGARLRAAFDRFTDLDGIPDRDAAAAIRDHGVDILIDLSGHTHRAHPAILALRPAPIQVSYLGYPATLGAGFMDYVIADPFVVPRDQQPHFAESLVHLPDTYMVNTPDRAVGEIPTRAAVGLPATGFVFCCFNDTYKITPGVFDRWMTILKGVPESVLWLRHTDDDTDQHLIREAEARGVPPERLIFAPRVPSQADHLARQDLADLFLDTLPYNAHTTASDALWMGLPVLTQVGKTFASRVAGSLLHAAGLAELVTQSGAEYVATARDLATDPVRLARIRTHLGAARSGSPLFDTARFTRHLEAAYRTMWGRHRGGDPPQPIVVPGAPPGV